MTGFETMTRARFYGTYAILAAIGLMMLGGVAVLAYAVYTISNI